MRLVSFVLALLLRTLLVTAQCQTCSCNGCLATLDPNARYAISSTAEPTASSACYSWADMSTTITPPTVTTTSTYTQNVSVGATTTTTTQVTSTLIVVGTATTTQYQTNVYQTVTTAIATASTTSTVIVTSTAPNPSTKSFLRRQATSVSAAAAIPSQYSPYCSASFAFSSACRCIGITQRTSTATAPTTTVTVTVTQSVVSGTAILVMTSTIPATTNTVATQTSSVVIGTTTVSTASAVATTRILTTATTTVTASNTVVTATPSGYLRVRAATTPVPVPASASAGAVFNYFSLNGRWLQYSKAGSANGATKLKLTTSSDMASNWTLVDSAYGAYLKSADLSVQAVISSWDNQAAGPNNGYDTVFAATAGQITPDLALVTCSDATAADGPLRCATTRESNGANNQTTRTILQYCNDQSNNSTGSVVLDNILEPGCIQLDLYWEKTLPAPYILNTDKKNYVYPRNQYLYVKNNSKSAACGIKKPMLVDYMRHNFYNFTRLSRKHPWASSNLVILNSTRDPWLNTYYNTPEPPTPFGAWNYSGVWRNWTMNWSELYLRRMATNDLNSSFLSNGPLFDNYRLCTYMNQCQMFNQLFDRFTEEDWESEFCGYGANDSYPYYHNRSHVPPDDGNNSGGTLDPDPISSDLNGLFIGVPMTVLKSPAYLLTDREHITYRDTNDSFVSYYTAPPQENNTYNSLSFAKEKTGFIAECNLWSDGHIDCSEINRHDTGYYLNFEDTDGVNDRTFGPLNGSYLRLNSTLSRFQACPRDAGEGAELTRASYTSLDKNAPQGKYFNWRTCMITTTSPFGTYKKNETVGCTKNVNWATVVSFLPLPKTLWGWGLINKPDWEPTPGCCDIDLAMAPALEDIPNFVFE